LSIRRQTTLSRGFKLIIHSGIVATALAASVASASAQNIFEAFFGRLFNPGASAYADPNAALRNAEQPEASGTAFCVRTCDGRYFPIQRHAGVSPAQTCSSFCPAAETRIYNGGSIDHAVASDGKRYGELNTAFVYRDRLVPGCSCNGRDAFGLVNQPVAEDPTLRPGDIVATNSGLMAYDATPGKQPGFTPIDAYAALTPELRWQLAETKIAPATERPAPPPAKQAQAPVASTRNKRAQADSR
jgi:hypothetical protein